MWEDKINNSPGIDFAIWAEIPDPSKFSMFYKTGKRKKIKHISKRCEILKVCLTILGRYALKG